MQVIDGEHVELDEPNDDFVILIENNDLLINELYSKERGLRVEYFGIQLDEMCGAARADFRGKQG